MNVTIKRGFMSFSRCFKLIATLLAVLVGMSFAASGKKIASGKFRYSVGEVFLHRNGETQVVKSSEPSKLKQAKNVREGDDIETLTESEVIIGLPDGSSFNIQENTIVSITKLSFEDGENHFETAIKKGNMSFDVQKQANGKSTFKFKTGTATAAIRGTRGTVGLTPKSQKPIFSLKDGILDIAYNNSNYTILEGQTAIPNGEKLDIVNLKGSGDPSLTNDLITIIDSFDGSLDSLIQIINSKDSTYSSHLDSLMKSAQCKVTDDSKRDTIYDSKYTFKVNCPPGIQVRVSDSPVLSDGSDIELMFEMSQGSIGPKRITLTCISDSTTTYQCGQLSAYYAGPQKPQSNNEYKSLTVSTSSPITVCKSSSVTIEGSFDPNEQGAKLFVRAGSHTSEDLVPQSANGEFSYTFSVSDKNGLWDLQEATVVYQSAHHNEEVTVQLDIHKECKPVNLQVPAVKFLGYDSLAVSKNCKATVGITNQKNDEVFFTTSIDNLSKNSIETNKDETQLQVELDKGVHTYEFSVKDIAGNSSKITKTLGCYPPIDGAAIVLYKGERERLRVPPPPGGIKNSFHRTLSFKVDKLPQGDPIYIHEVRIEQAGKKTITLRGTDLQSNRIDQDIELTRSKQDTKIYITVILKNGTTLQATKTYEVR